MYGRLTFENRVRAVDVVVYRVYGLYVTRVHTAKRNSGWNEWRDSVVEPSQNKHVGLREACGRMGN